MILNLRVIMYLHLKRIQPSELISGQENKKLIASYQMNDFVNNIYKENANTWRN